MASVDREPDLVAELRGLRSRLSELERRALGLGRLRQTTKVRGGTASLPTASEQDVSFSILDVDQAGAWDPAQPTRLTAQRDGLYIVSAFAQIAFNATGDRQVSFNPAWGLDSGRAPATADYQTNPTIIVPMTSGEWVSLGLWQNSGVTLAASACTLTLAWLGDL